METPTSRRLLATGEKVSPEMKRAQILERRCSLFAKVFGDINELKKKYNQIIQRKAYESMTKEVLCDDAKDCFGQGVCSIKFELKQCECKKGFKGIFCTWTDEMYAKI